MDKARNWSPIVEKLNKKERFAYLDQVASRFNEAKFKAIVNLDERIRNAMMSSICYLRNELAPLRKGNDMLFRVREAADYLGVSQQTIRNWHYNCKLVPDLISESGYRYYSLKQLKLFRQSSKKYRDKPMIKKLMMPQSEKSPFLFFH